MNQQQYASLDAHCLIGIFDALLLEKDIDIGLNVAKGLYNWKQRETREKKIDLHQSILASLGPVTVTTDDGKADANLEEIEDVDGDEDDNNGAQEQDDEQEDLSTSK